MTAIPTPASLAVARSFFGFKAHIAVDQGSDIIRDGVLTGADIGDSLACGGLIPSLLIQG